MFSFQSPLPFRIFPLGEGHLSWNRCGTPRVRPSVRPTCVVYNVTPGSPVSTSSPPRPGRPRPSLRPRCGGVPPTTGTFCNRRAPVLGAPVRHKSLRAAQPQPSPARLAPRALFMLITGADSHMLRTAHRSPSVCELD